jgi:hypothetical protein
LRKLRHPPPGPPDLFGYIKNYWRRPDGTLVVFRRIGRVPKQWPRMITGCVDCGIGTSTLGEYPYIVRDDVWEQAWIGRRKSWQCQRPDGRIVEGQEVLCIGCLERRLGRTLIASDFPADILCNDPHQRHISQRLRDRLTATISRRLRGRPKGSKNRSTKTSPPALAIATCHQGGQAP